MPDYHIISPGQTSGNIITHAIPSEMENPQLVWDMENVSLVVSLLDEETQEYLDKIEIYGRFDYVHFPIDDYDIPDSSEMNSLVDRLLKLLEEGKNIAVHCFAGHGRTGTLTAILYGLIKNTNGDSAIDEIRQTYPAYVDTASQAKFVSDFIRTRK